MITFAASLKYNILAHIEKSTSLPVRSRPRYLLLFSNTIQDEMGLATWTISISTLKGSKLNAVVYFCCTEICVRINITNWDSNPAVRYKATKYMSYERTICIAISMVCSKFKNCTESSLEPWPKPSHSESEPVPSCGRQTVSERNFKNKNLYFRC